MGVEDDARDDARDDAVASTRGEKRVKNDRMKRALERYARGGLEFPSAYQGLRAIAEEEGLVRRDDAFATWFDARFAKLSAGEYADVRFTPRDDDDDDDDDGSAREDGARARTTRREMPRRGNGERSRWMCEFS
jgi:hypothetical protein